MIRKLLPYLIGIIIGYLGKETIKSNLVDKYFTKKS